MTGGFGHLADMIVRMRNNATLLKKQTYLQKKESYLKAKSEILHDKKRITPEDLIKIHDDVKRFRRDEIKKSIISLVLATVLVGLALYLFLHFVMSFIKS
jgi:hypothetical protein